MRRLNLQLFALSLNTGTSIVDYLKSVGQDSSFGNRQKLAKQYGISNYTGTADQNTKLLNMLKSAGVASANTTNTNKKTNTNKNTASSTAAKNAIAGIASAISGKVADIATKNTAKEPKNTGNVVKDVNDYLVEATKPVSNSPNVSLPVSTGAIDSYISEIVKGNIGLYSVPAEYQAEIAKRLGLDLPTESTPTFTPVETPTFNYTPQNTPTFTPAQTPTYTAPTTQAQQATPMKDRLDQATLDKMNSQFQVSQAYTDAMNYTNQLLQQLGSGKTSYTDQLNQIMSEYSNRDKFSYSADSDPLFQQALASAMKSGSRAMSDTMGQAAALTGGYGSSYATSAGANAYNQFIDAAYDNLPEYYQIALDAYNQEGQSMLNRYDMLAQADSNEYNRLYNAYNANFNNAQTMYGNEYQAWADSVNNAYNYANMQNNEYWNQMNYDEGIRQYEQNFGYQQYLDQLNQSNWQNEFNYQQYRDQWQQSNADREFAYQQYLDKVQQSQWQNEFNYGQYMDQIKQNQWKDEFDFEKSEADRDQGNVEWEQGFKESEADRNQGNIDWEHGFEESEANRNQGNIDWEHGFKESEAERDQSNIDWEQGFKESEAERDQGNWKSEFDAKREDVKWEKEQAEKGVSGNSASGEAKLSNLTNTEIENVKEIYTEAGGGMNGNIAVDQYLTMIGKNNVDNATLAAMLASVEIPLEYQDWTIENDTNNGGFLWWKGEDHNDTYKYGDEILTYDELVERIEESDLSDAKKKELKKKLKEQSKN